MWPIPGRPWARPSKHRGGRTPPYRGVHGRRSADPMQRIWRQTGRKHWRRWEKRKARLARRRREVRR